MVIRESYINWDTMDHSKIYILPWNYPANIENKKNSH